MRSYLKYLSFIGFLLIHLLLNQPAYSQQFNIAVEDDAAPWSQKDGTGYANDVVRAFKAVNQDITLQVVPYSRCKEITMNGKVSACFNMSGIDNPEFKEKITFPKIPLFRRTIDYFVKNENLTKVQNQQNFEKKRSDHFEKYNQQMA